MTWASASETQIRLNDCSVIVRFDRIWRKPRVFTIIGRISVEYKTNIRQRYNDWQSNFSSGFSISGLEFVGAKSWRVEIAFAEIFFAT